MVSESLRASLKNPSCSLHYTVHTIRHLSVYEERRGGVCLVPVLRACGLFRNEVSSKKTMLMRCIAHTKRRYDCKVLLRRASCQRSSRRIPYFVEGNHDKSLARLQLHLPSAVKTNTFVAITTKPAFTLKLQRRLCAFAYEFAPIGIYGTHASIRNEEEEQLVAYLGLSAE